MAGLLNVIKGVGKGVGEVYDAGKGLLDQFDMDKIKGWHGTLHEFPSAVIVSEPLPGKIKRPEFSTKTVSSPALTKAYPNICPSAKSVSLPCVP